MGETAGEATARCWRLVLDYVRDYEALAVSPWLHAPTDGAARAAFAAALGRDPRGVAVAREPAGDGLPLTPANLLYVGIADWRPCRECGRKVYGDGGAHDGLYGYAAETGIVSAGVVDWRGAVYCSPACAGVDA